MERKIRIAVSIVTFIGFLVPQNASWRIGILWYLELETIVTAILIFFQAFSSFYEFVISGYMHRLSSAIDLFSTFFWIQALPTLLFWNLYLIKPRKNALKVAYKIWLLISLISTVFVSYSSTRAPITNLLLLFIAIGFEIWLWFTERRMKALE